MRPKVLRTDEETIEWKKKLKKRLSALFFSYSTSIGPRRVFVSHGFLSTFLITWKVQNSVIIATTIKLCC